MKGSIHFFFELVIAVAQVFEDASEYGVKGPFERIREYESDMFAMLLSI